MSGSFVRRGRLSGAVPRKAAVLSSHKARQAVHEGPRHSPRACQLSSWARNALLARSQKVLAARWHYVGRPRQTGITPTHSVA